ncbi:MAG: general secretion pathway protein GspK [Deltaproteobacteria bacterium]|nr:general secretion pathway protein GspK [Deltaproteobacteria bacterium]
MVLASLLIITTIAVEFAYNSHVAYELASSQRDQLAAYYLARSAINLQRVELKIEKQLRAQYAGQLGQVANSGITSEPFCKQMPLSTGLLKGLSSGLLTGGPAKPDEATKKEETPAPEAKKDLEKGSPAQVVEGAKDFLDFNGDFEAVCDTEERKINLNIFRADPLAASGTQTGTQQAVTPQSLYDDQKSMLYALLMQKEYESIFKGRPDEVKKVVNAIADWADKDDQINEAPGLAGGAEDSLYTSYGYKVKNGKYASVAEILLVAGVGDDLYQKLAPELTVYGDNKINVCQASAPMVRAYITKFAQTNPGIPTISPNDTSAWAKVETALQLVCNTPAPQPVNVAAAITSALGVPPVPALASQISTVNRFYRIEATGEVNGSRVRLVTILDGGQIGAAAWKPLYFRVE